MDINSVPNRFDSPMKDGLVWLLDTFPKIEDYNEYNTIDSSTIGKYVKTCKIQYNFSSSIKCHRI